MLQRKNAIAHSQNFCTNRDYFEGFSDDDEEHGKNFYLKKNFYRYI